MKKTLLVPLVSFALVFGAFTQIAFAATLTVDPVGCDVSGIPSYCTIQAAVDAATDGDVINVAPGTYTESVNLTHAVTLHGASKVSTFIVGQVTVATSSVSVSGFDITNPAGDFGILISHVGSVTVSDNNIHDVGTTADGTNKYGVWFQSSGSNDVSDITISNNTISAIGSATNAKSSGGIGIGDSSSHMNITSGLSITGNTISNVNSSTKGAYGILLNLGAASDHVADTASITGASITDNNISGLTGGWEHGIGLETDTPNAIVTGNIIHDLSAGADVEAVHFEKTRAHQPSRFQEQLSTVKRSQTPILRFL